MQYNDYAFYLLIEKIRVQVLLRSMDFSGHERSGAIFLREGPQSVGPESDAAIRRKTLPVSRLLVFFRFRVIN